MPLNGIAQLLLACDLSCAGDAEGRLPAMQAVPPANQHALHEGQKEAADEVFEQLPHHN